MKTQLRIALLMLAPAVSVAQIPVDDDGNVVAAYESQVDTLSTGDGGIPLLSAIEMQELVGPIALYPDDLLAIVLPAAAYPLQLVEAARFLDALETDPTLKPNADWDDSIVALLNYPEVVELLNKDLDWTLRLGEAVIAQQAAVVAAVETFRDRAYTAGNLKSDSHQTVSREDDVISISPAEEDVIYVPYYEPTEVVYYQTRPVYHYYPRSYPVYYYPYDSGHYFSHGYFWGVTTAFSIGWLSDSLHVYHHSYRGHPYYGHSYWNNWWYRSPSIRVYNNHYSHRTSGHNNRHAYGDRWHVRGTRREYIRREGYARSERRSPEHRTYNYQSVQRAANKEQRNEPISFRERQARPVTQTRTPHTRNTRRQEPVRSSRDTHRTDRVIVARNSRRSDTVDRPRSARHEQPVSRRNYTTREQPARQSRQRAPTRVDRAPARAERAPARTERAPAPRQQRQQTESRQRSEPSRSQESRDHGSRSRSRDRQRR